MRQRLTLLLWSLWLGIGVGVAFVAIPAIFTTARPDLPPGEPGSTAQAVLYRYFLAQAGIATLLALLELPAWLARRNAPRWRPAALGFLLASCLASLLWLHPAVSDEFHKARKAPAPPAGRLATSARFRMLHGASQGLNLATLLLVLAQWSAAARPIPPAAPSTMPTPADGP